MRKILGISLLELMLSLAIISIMLVAAIRYYQTTRAAQETNEALNTLQSTFIAADNWYWTFKDFENTPNGAISTQQLQGLGLLPKDFTNPWGGEVTIVPMSANEIQINLNHIPKEDCANLVTIMQKQNVQGNCEEDVFVMQYTAQQH